jgi:flagella basal body P-ring formation protein FlgA
MRKAIRLVAGAVLASAAVQAAADTVVASRMIRALEILAPADISVTPDEVPGAIASPSEALGLEARTNLYAGRPIRPGDLGPPALIERNETVVINYHHAGLAITAEGRALGRGGIGERIKVMNLTSRTTVVGTVLVDGSINVGPSGP